jgi:uncharacterized membrane protein
MPHLKTVTELDERRSHWIAKPIAGKTFEWDAEIIDEVEGEHIGWRSLPGSDVISAGSVHFKPLEDGGTDVQVTLQYAPPAGRVGRFVARLLGDDPSTQIRSDLQRFKELMEGTAASTQSSGAFE